jgi:hypothetical protein
LLVGQAIPREWLQPGAQCGLERAATYFGPVSVHFTGAEGSILARLDGPRRNAPKQIELRFRTPNERPLKAVTVNGKKWKQFNQDVVELPGNCGQVEVSAHY